MSTGLTEIFADSAFLQLSGLLGLTLFFILVGFREIRHERPEGYLFLTISVFLAISHAVLLSSLASAHLKSPLFENLSLWVWLVALLAPAICVIFIVRALFNFAVEKHREGLIKLFFGLTLVCYLYLLGSNWPLDVRGFLTIIWLSFLFKTELAVAN